MARYSLEFSRISYFREDVEANSLAEAKAIAEQMSAGQVRGCHDYDGDFEFEGAFPIDDEGNHLEEPELPLRVGPDEIAAAWTEVFAVPEFCQ
jgi:hypothetical protein